MGPCFQILYRWYISFTAFSGLMENEYSGLSVSRL